MAISGAITRWSLLAVFALLLNKYIPYACVVFCLAWRQCGWHKEYEALRKQDAVGSITANEDHVKSPSPKHSPRPKQRSIIDLNPPRSKGTPRQRKYYLKPLPAPSRDSQHIVYRIGARISPWLPEYASVLWYLDKFLIVSMFFRQSYEFVVAVYNDQITHRPDVLPISNYPMTCHTVQQLIIMFVPMIFSVLGLRVTRGFLSEAASPRFGTMWMIEEPWLLSIITFFGHIFIQETLYNTHSDHFPECTPRVMQRRLPPFAPYSNPYFLMIFDRTIDPLGVL